MSYSAALLLLIFLTPTVFQEDQQELLGARKLISQESLDEAIKSLGRFLSREPEMPMPTFCLERR
ncbi:MAG: hypothetical protein ACRD1R_09885 [Acidobacteriota bacterium]